MVLEDPDEITRILIDRPSVVFHTKKRFEGGLSPYFTYYFYTHYVKIHTLTYKFRNFLAHEHNIRLLSFLQFGERETGAKFAVKSNTFSRLSRWHISKTSAHLALENLCA